MFNTGLVAITWSTMKQPTISLSTTEVEYKEAIATTCEVVWLKRIMEDLKEEQKEAIKIHYDNQSIIQMMKNPVLHGRMKHIKIQHHFIRELVQKGDIKLIYSNREDQVAKIFTKSLSKIKHYRFRDMLGVLLNMHYGGVLE